MGVRRLVSAVGGAALAALALTAPAGAAVPHTVVPGESLWAVDAVNGFAFGTVAAANGLAADAHLVAGEEIQIPAAGEGAVPAVDSGVVATDAAGTASPSAPPPSDATAVAQGMVPIHHPSATPYLAPEAAAAWEAMRQESLQVLGIDLYPIGALSGYRTYEQQAYFWDLYLAGEGNPANPPGTSSHETGNAVDLATPEMRAAIDQLGAAYGWQKVEAHNEWWHVNYVGGYGG